MVSAFQAQLATRQFPVKEMSPADFQDLLKKCRGRRVEKGLRRQHGASE